RGCIDGLTERMVNTVIQASKAIKNNTNLSFGSVSVAHAAVKCITDQHFTKPKIKILLVGTGKIGRAVAKNLAHHIKNAEITLINRTALTANTLAVQLGFSTAPFEELKKHAAAADVIITAARADHLLITDRDIQYWNKRLLIDIAIPANIDQAVKFIPGVKLITIDMLSQQAEETISYRSDAIPAALYIIEKHLNSLIKRCNLEESRMAANKFGVFYTVIKIHQNEPIETPIGCPIIVAEQVLLQSPNCSNYFKPL
ncbi:MAG TPA: NAD(P)-binding domain-containing protein, partial [Mucilaginibacter sp.]|nr:NAD(P)-binding domain-containing protein [Mucilaginibacter sp.]